MSFIIYLILYSEVMFSTVFTSEYTENIISVEQILKKLQDKGYAFFKTRRQLESGLSASSLMVQKNGLTIIVLAMKLAMRSIICACYHRSRLILQRQLEYEQQIVDVIQQTYNNIKSRRNEETNLDIQLQKLRGIAIRKESSFKDLFTFSQEMKLSPEYADLLTYEKKLYEKVINDSQYVLENKKKIKSNNQELLDPLLKIQENKQSLQNIMLAYEDQRQYLSNPKNIFQEIIDEKKKKTDDLHLYLLNQTVFSQYLEELVEIESLKIKVEAAGL